MIVIRFNRNIWIENKEKEELCCTKNVGKGVRGETQGEWEGSGKRGSWKDFVLTNFTKFILFIMVRLILGDIKLSNGNCDLFKRRSAKRCQILRFIWIQGKRKEEWRIDVKIEMKEWWKECIGIEVFSHKEGKEKGKREWKGWKWVIYS